jgi:hypothetical protein
MSLQEKNEDYHKIYGIKNGADYIMRAKYEADGDYYTLGWTNCPNAALLMNKTQIKHLLERTKGLQVAIFNRIDQTIKIP